MSQIDDGGPAFPRTGNNYTEKYQSGMTLRDWFAGQALAGMLADPNNNGHYTDNAAASYKFADAMLAARLTKPE